MSLDAIDVLLVESRDGRNVGAAARALANGGLSHLHLVAPDAFDEQCALHVAVQAEQVITGARRWGSLEEAIAGASWVVGTTGRGLPGQRHLTPVEFAREALERSRSGRVALVFGSEHHGLTEAQLLCCHAVSAIPAAPSQPSFNLGQAVAIYSSALFQASGEIAAVGPEGEPTVTDAEVAQLERALRAFAEAADFTDPDRPGHGIRELAFTLRRSGLNRAELKLWQAVLFRGAAAARRAR